MSEEKSLYKHREGSPISSWVFGAALLIFFVFIIFIIPEPSVFQASILRFLIASCAGFLAHFFIGGVVIKGKIRNDLELSAGGGFALFVLIQFVFDPLKVQSMAGDLIPSVVPHREEIKYFQASLNALGKYAGEIDGIPTTAIREKISEFQELNGLQKTGWVDHKTLDLIDAAVNSDAEKKDQSHQLVQNAKEDLRNSENRLLPQLVIPQSQPEELIKPRDLTKSESNEYDAALTKDCRYIVKIFQAIKANDFEELKNNLMFTNSYFKRWESSYRFKSFDACNIDSHGQKGTFGCFRKYDYILSPEEISTLYADYEDYFNRIKICIAMQHNIKMIVANDDGYKYGILRKLKYIDREMLIKLQIYSRPAETKNAVYIPAKTVVDLSVRGY